jgi:hypothetical protein
LESPAARSRRFAGFFLAIHFTQAAAIRFLENELESKTAFGVVHFFSDFDFISDLLEVGFSTLFSNFRD